MTTVVVTGGLMASSLANAQRDTTTDGNNGTLPTPPGLFVTPTAPLSGAIQQPLNPRLANYPNFVAGEAVKSVVSPDGRTLAILTAGENSLYNASGVVDAAASTQFIFLYDISGNNKTNPVLRQVIQQLNSHVGLAWAPNSQILYVAGGCDDAVYAYASQGANFVQSAKISLGHAPTGCASGTANQKGLGLQVQPNVAGLAISADGRTLVAANNYNDSISIIDTATNTIRYEYDLRPYSTSGAPNGTKGGTFPFSVVLNGSIAYVGIDRDREVVAVNISNPTAGAFVARIALDGNANGMALSVDGSTLYVTQDNQDQVAAINTATNTVTRRIDTRGPSYLGLPASVTGAAPTAVTINPVNNTLYAVNAGSNSIAVIPLSGGSAFTTTGLIPTAYDPTDVAFSADGTWMYVVNGKSDTGPNPGYGFGNLGTITYLTYPGGNSAKAAQLRANNQYQFQLEHATLVSAQVPTLSDLSNLTSAVAANNAYSVTPPANDAQVMNFLHSKIQHVIYIVKENRTFDQILGDLGNGSNGDPSLTLFGKRVTPSFHSMAANFVTLDNFMDPGDGSMDGWSWSMRGRVTNSETISQQENYAAINRGLSYEGEGANRNVPVNLPTVAARDLYFDPSGSTTPFSTGTATQKGGPANILAGDGDHAATDGPGGYQQGYIFNAVLNAGGTVRNYGWLANNVGGIGTIANPIRDPFAAGIVQVTMNNQLLAENRFFDPYFRGYDNVYPDLWRVNEWNREFQQFVTNNNLPSLSMVRLSHDHTGSFTSALAGVNTPELQEADNDYSVGLLVQAVANSKYASNTLIFIIEDDCQDGADHVDSHRSTTYVVGPYVKQRAVVSTRYSQTSVLRTIEDIFATQHLNLNTYYTRPMADAFDINSSGAWNFTATASTLLKSTSLLPADMSKVNFDKGPDLKPTHTPQYWASRTRGFDFSREDRVPADRYNKILWEGIKKTKAPVPHTHFQSTGADRDGDDDDK
jgi:YVTN family beta-propeller protein